MKNILRNYFLQNGEANSFKKSKINISTMCGVRNGIIIPNKGTIVIVIIRSWVVHGFSCLLFVLFANKKGFNKNLFYGTVNYTFQLSAGQKQRLDIEVA